MSQAVNASTWLSRQACIQQVPALFPPGRALGFDSAVQTPWEGTRACVMKGASRGGFGLYFGGRGGTESGHRFGEPCV